MMSKHYEEYQDEMYDQERNERIADRLEAYIDAVDNLLIIEGVTVDDIKKAKKVIKKAAKDLRKGHPEKVYDEERFYELLDQGLLE